MMYRVKNASASLQTAADSTGQLTLFPGTYKLSRPLMLRKGSQLVGAGTGLKGSTILADYDYGPVVCSLSYKQLEAGGGGPLLDSDGLILGSECYSYVDFSESREFWFPPTDGSWRCNFDYRWDSGSGVVIAGGGSTKSSDVPAGLYTGFFLTCDQHADGTLFIGGNTAGQVVVTTALTPSTWYNVDVSISPTGTFTAKLNSITAGTYADHPFSQKWYHRLTTGYYPTVFPGRLNFTQSNTLKGRMKNFRLYNRLASGGYSQWSMDKGNDHFVPSDPGNPYKGFLVIKPIRDLGTEMLNVRVSDLEITGGGWNTGMYICNTQRSVFENLVVGAGCQDGTYLHANCYMIDMHGNYWLGSRVACVANSNAHQFAQYNTTFQGSRCGFAMTDSYGTTLSDGWMFGTGAQAGCITCLADGDGVTFSMNNMKIFDEGVGYGPVILQLRGGVFFTGTGNSFSRGLATTGADGPVVVAADGLNNAVFLGGKIEGKGGGSAAVFNVDGSAPLNKIRIDHVRKSSGTPDWYSAGQSASFEVSDFQ